MQFVLVLWNKNDPSIYTHLSKRVASSKVDLANDHGQLQTIDSMPTKETGASRDLPKFASFLHRNGKDVLGR